MQAVGKPEAEGRLSYMTTCLARQTSELGWPSEKANGHVGTRLRFYWQSSDVRTSRLFQY